MVSSKLFLSRARLGSMGYTVSVIASLLCHCAWKAAIDDM